jgi:hypothetical protein
MEALRVEHLDLALGQWGSLVCEERFLWTPGQNSCSWSLAHMPTLVESLVFLGQFCHLSFEVGISFVHTRVSALSEVIQVSMLLRGGCLGHFALKTMLESVQIIQT